VVVYDNYCNSSAESLQRVEFICGKKPHLVEGDVLDADGKRARCSKRTSP
jgi:UDP-glucose 4-epimerase